MREYTKGALCGKCHYIETDPFLVPSCICGIPNNRPLCRACGTDDWYPVKVSFTRVLGFKYDMKVHKPDGTMRVGCPVPYEEVT